MTVMFDLLTSQGIGYHPFQTAVRDPVPVWAAMMTPRPCYGDGFVRLGVNLEGMRYDDWPVARLIERDISRPLLLTRYPPRGRKTR